MAVLPSCLLLLSLLCLAAQVHSYGRVFVVVLGNTGFEDAQADAYLSQLSAKGQVLSNYHVVTDAVQGNLVSMVGGDTLVADDNVHGLDGESLVDVLERSKVSWKAYFQDFPGDCFLGSTGLYHRKYNPFITFNNIRNNRERCARIVEAAELDTDIESGALPRFALYAPNMNNNGNAGLSAATAWLQGFLAPKLNDARFMEGTLLVVTFASTSSKGDSRTFTLLLGSGIEPASQDSARYDHYSLLRTAEDALGAGNLGRRDATAPAFAAVAASVNKHALKFKKLFMILLENQPLKATVKNSVYRTFASKGTLLTNYNAIVNPSQPNYIALVSGDLMGVHGDSDYNLEGRFIVDLMEEKGVSWKGYMENYPGNCYAGTQSPDTLYKRKHNPFISYAQVRNNETLCSKIVNADQLYQDVQDDALPQYSFFTPNINNDGHDTGIAYSAHWLDGFLSPLLRNENFTRDTLVVVTYDEGIYPDNRIYTLLLGENIPGGHLDPTYYTHYSLLRLAEDTFSLGNLGRADVSAPPITSRNFVMGAIPYVNVGLLVGLLVGGAVAFGAASTGAIILIRRRYRKYKPIDIDTDTTQGAKPLAPLSNSV